MRENERDGYVEYGEDNQYPDYLLMLVNRSSKHGAIIEGKAQYILGKGVKIRETVEDKVKVEMYLDQMNPNMNYNEFTDRIIKDLEIFNGVAIEVAWKPNGKYTLNHIPFGRIRSNIDSSKFYYNTDWQRYNNKVKPIEYEPFDENKRDVKKRYLYYYKVYNPASYTYPIPSYIGAVSWINTDIEIANFHYNNIKNGFFGGSMITFISGEPTQEEKRVISDMFKMSKTGTENAGRFVINFANSIDKIPKIDTLIPSDNDKMFDILNKTCTQELFIGHRINNSQLFGVRIEGQLGGRTEIVEAYEMFKKTYINNRQQIIESILNYHIQINTMVKDAIYLEPTEPVSLDMISSEMIARVMTNEEIRMKVGLPTLAEDLNADANKTSDAINSLSPLVANKVLESMSPDEIRGLASLPPTGNNSIPTTTTDTTSTETIVDTNQELVNDNIKNLTGRQHQIVMRTIRDYNKGKITVDHAKLLLRAGYGLSEEDINLLLAIPCETEEFKHVAFSNNKIAKSTLSVEDAIGIFSKYGLSSEKFSVIKRNLFSFEDLSKNDDHYISVYLEESKDMKKVLRSIGKDSTLTEKQLSEMHDIPIEKVKKILQDAIDDNYIKVRVTDDTPQLEVTNKGNEVIKNINNDNFKIKTYYEYAVRTGFGEPIISTTRDFCRELIGLKKIYSRKEIDMISAELGYNAWLLRGGWYHNKKTDINEPFCRHVWRQVLVTEKI